jgi:hypothetical protein
MARCCPVAGFCVFCNRASIGKAGSLRRAGAEPLCGRLACAKRNNAGRCCTSLLNSSGLPRSKSSGLGGQRIYNDQNQEPRAAHVVLQSLFPITFIEPLSAGRPSIGFDLSADPACGDVFFKIAESGMPHIGLLKAPLMGNVLKLGPTHNWRKLGSHVSSLQSLVGAASGSYEDQSA